MEREISVYDAKNQLSKLIAYAEQGDTVIITRNNKPVVKFLYIGTRKRPVYGLNAGQFPSVPREAFAPLSDKELREFYGE
jgi:antitoxin (DNA-binding transcriptional repressor) of toxin-antitoxin stability system